ncbi:hypothetical protein GCM10022221_03640 [Actinocorallia aurea]
MITNIKINGFKSFLDFELDVPPFLALVGPNASGKSNLFDALTLVADVLQFGPSGKRSHSLGRGALPGDGAGGRPLSRPLVPGLVAEGDPDHDFLRPVIDRFLKGVLVENRAADFDLSATVSSPAVKKHGKDRFVEAAQALGSAAISCSCTPITTRRMRPWR